MLLLGSYSPIELDLDQITRRFTQSGASTALQAVGISAPAALLATWVTGRDGLERYAGDAKLVTDDHPRIEYAPWVRPREITRVLPKLLALRTDPPLIGSSTEIRAHILHQLESLLDFYAAGIAAYIGIARIIISNSKLMAWRAIHRDRTHLTIPPSQAIPRKCIAAGRSFAQINTARATWWAHAAREMRIQERTTSAFVAS